MGEDAIELLTVCRVAEDLWEQMPERPSGVRAEIDRLWRLYAQLLSTSSDIKDDDVLDLIALTRQLRLSLDPEFVLAARTEVLIGVWRDAEQALVHADAGTLSWLIARRAAETARDSYHARLNALLGASAGSRPMRRSPEHAPS